MSEQTMVRLFDSDDANEDWCSRNCSECVKSAAIFPDHENPLAGTCEIDAAMGGAGKHVNSIPLPLALRCGWSPKLGDAQLWDCPEMQVPA